jgi:type III restriction enzyme
VLVVEYKGDHLRQVSASDNRIGKAMEQASEGKCLFLMVFKNENGLDMRAQLKKKVSL